MLARAQRKPTRRRGKTSRSPCTLTPHDQVSRGFVDPPRVGGQTGVGAGVGGVRGADEQAAGLQEREARQLDRAAGQDALPWETRGGCMGSGCRPGTLTWPRAWTALPPVPGPSGAGWAQAGSQL